jgi:hypothetical protein
MQPKIVISPDIVDKVSYILYFYSCTCLESMASHYQLDSETKMMVKNNQIKTTKKMPPMLFSWGKNNFVFKNKKLLHKI